MGAGTARLRCMQTKRTDAPRQPQRALRQAQAARAHLCKNVLGLQRLHHGFASLVHLRPGRGSSSGVSHGSAGKCSRHAPTVAAGPPRCQTLRQGNTHRRLKALHVDLHHAAPARQRGRRGAQDRVQRGHAELPDLDVPGVERQGTQMSRQHHITLQPWQVQGQPMHAAAHQHPAPTRYAHPGRPPLLRASGPQRA